MKKIISLLCIFVLLLTMATPAFAKTGDILGKYLATDIKTYLNGAPIDAINIGGNTLISAEDMAHYGFNVTWYPVERELAVLETTGKVDAVRPVEKSQTKPTGTPLGYYYETDIVTYLDDAPIAAYNIGGRTYMHAEAMRDFGYLVNWYENLRKLEILSPKYAELDFEMTLSYGKNHGYGVDGGTGVDGTGVFNVTYTKNGIIGINDADYFDMKLYATGQDYRFEVKFYQNAGLFNSETLINRMKTLCYEGYGVETPCDKEQMYDLVNQTLSVFINGQRAEKVSVTAGAGNGHRDFYFTVHDLPAYTKDEINEIVFSFGEVNGVPYEIVSSY